MKALIADDREDARRALADALRRAGVTAIDAVPAAVGGTRLVALITGSTELEDPAGAGTAPANPADLVMRFSHDVASPLMCIMALSELLVHEQTASARMSDDLRQIQTAARQVANMVRTLGIRSSSGRAAPSA